MQAYALPEPQSLQSLQDLSGCLGVSNLSGVSNRISATWDHLRAGCFIFGRRMEEFATLDASIGYCFKLMIEGEYGWLIGEWFGKWCAWHWYHWFAIDLSMTKGVSWAGGWDHHPDIRWYQMTSVFCPCLNAWNQTFHRQVRLALLRRRAWLLEIGSPAHENMQWIWCWVWQHQPLEELLYHHVLDVDFHGPFKPDHVEPRPTPRSVFSLDAAKHSIRPPTFASSLVERQNMTGWWFGCHFLFPRNIGFLIIPIDELIFFRGVAQPPTRWQRMYQVLAIILDVYGSIRRETGKSETASPPQSA